MHDNHNALAHTLELAARIAALALVLGGCGDGPTQPGPGAGVVFTYPHDGQLDVPVGARVVLSFTHPVDEAALATGCAGSEDGEMIGPLCITGPDGPIDSAAAITGDAHTVIHLQPDTLVPGAEYQVYVRPELVNGNANNLPQSGPLLRFRTRSSEVRPAELPALVSLNGEDPAVFAAAGQGAQPRFPMLDFTTLRLLMSEPVDPVSVVAGSSLRFLEVAGDTETDVPGQLLAQGIHLTFDPDQDLRPGARYRLLLDGIRDLGGEAMDPVELELVPQDTRTGGMMIEQILETVPAGADGGSPAISSRLGAVLNSLAISSQLIGATTIHLAQSTLRAEMGNAQAFGKRIPLTIRAGQRLAAAGLDVHLGGLIPAGLSTGDIEIRLISDGVGWLTRSPYRADDVLPDDDQAPVYLYLYLDLAVTARDATGNAVLNQTVLGVAATGVAYGTDGALNIAGAGALELDLLGAAVTPVNIALGLRTTAPGTTMAPQDTESPRLQRMSPAEGQSGVGVRQTMRLTFTEAVTIEPDSVRLAASAAPAEPLPADVVVRGATIEVTPRAALADDSYHVLAVAGGVTDMAGNPLELRASDPSGGDGTITFRTMYLGGAQTAPLLTAVHPGAPCALAGGTDGAPGPCVDGNSSDDSYVPFELPANRMIEAYLDQPIDPATVTLGQECNTGSVRVEQRDAGGTCQSVVPGVLVPHGFGFRFLPAQPWAPGHSYALVLSGGSNDTCSSGEICGRNGQPLNTDQLDSTDDTEGGGPDVVIPFTGAPATRDTYFLLGTAPYADTNGNGVLDDRETPRAENRAALAITGTSGVISSATMNGADCVPETPETEGCAYFQAALPVSLGAPRLDCVIGQDTDGSPVVVDTCMPVRIYPGIVYGTALGITARVVVGIGVNTGRLVLRIRESAPNIGYIVMSEDQTPMLVAQLDAYLDAPDMSVVGGLAGHDLHSKPLTLSVAGPVEFTEDGRIRIRLGNTNAIDLTVAIDLLSLGLGSVDLQIPAGALSLQLVGHRRARQ